MINWKKIDTVLLDMDGTLLDLNSARLFGIAHLISVSKPDSKQPKKDVTGYPTIGGVRELMIGL